jgi:hypothetical protein
MSLRGAPAGERGQATVEWIGLVLGLAVAFGGALALTRGADFEGEANGLGEALASRMTCAARAACAAEAGAGRRGAGRRSGGAVGARALRGGASVGLGVPPRGGSGSAPRGLRGLDGAGAGARVGVRRAFEKARKYGWAACLGYRRLRYDLDHPRFFPRDTIPPGEILDELNACLNPWKFLFG